MGLVRPGKRRACLAAEAEIQEDLPALHDGFRSTVPPRIPAVDGGGDTGAADTVSESTALPLVRPPASLRRGMPQRLPRSDRPHRIC